jgi:hypothetical protein
MNRRQRNPYREKMLIHVKDKDDTKEFGSVPIQLGRCVRIQKGKNYPKERRKKIDVIQGDPITKSRIRIQLVLWIRNQGTKSTGLRNTRSRKANMILKKREKVKNLKAGCFL